METSPLFTIVPIIIGLVFLIVISMFLFKAGKGVAEWSNNNSLPSLTIESKIIQKRVDKRIHNRLNHDTHQTSTSSSNTYYISFEKIGSKERHSFAVSRKEFDIFMEDDIGKLTYQGTRFHNFELL